ncbi:MAG: hypothetical protein AAGC82_12490 [Pseudomonadota bacterium]
MSVSMLTKRFALALIAMLMASSVSALDIACCGDGPDGPDWSGPDEIAAPEADDGPDEPEGGSGGGDGDSITGADQDECLDAGGAYITGLLCYDIDGNYVPI